MGTPVGSYSRKKLIHEYTFNSRQTGRDHTSQDVVESVAVLLMSHDDPFK